MSSSMKSSFDCRVRNSSANSLRAAPSSSVARSVSSRSLRHWSTRNCFSSGLKRLSCSSARSLLRAWLSACTPRVETAPLSATAPSAAPTIARSSSISLRALPTSVQRSTEAALSSIFLFRSGMLFLNASSCLENSSTGVSASGWPCVWAEAAEKGKAAARSKAAARRARRPDSRRLIARRLIMASSTDRRHPATLRGYTMSEVRRDGVRASAPFPEFLSAFRPELRNQGAWQLYDSSAAFGFAVPDRHWHACHPTTLIHSHRPDWQVKLEHRPGRWLAGLFPRFSCRISNPDLVPACHPALAQFDTC